ncbi:MAG: hypothetical protein GW808_01195 [Sphingomonadales bacterium]|nr:hypothetical protein [Sphingomonadales bacterium]PIX66358.1 MAG: hypothetical protein COZ43_07080 [Sphingomonadales bacterium CG_4_10_14_3_um_filter_58_15]NCO47971.1 hypothetical protein [Sphingomonadales bacterium]NCP01189.1 hypothetical protein [Sphingomonadales bacterium]NCP25845.1 hypothetical protein [Sphingomonadales bacterium]
MRVSDYIGCAALVLASVSLAACADNDPGDSPDNAVDEATGNATPLAETARDSAIPAMDFDKEQPGAKIEGPVGPEVNASFLLGGKSYGDIESYVACPANISTCNPKILPADTVYTYVHVVTPGVDKDNDKPFLPNKDVMTVTATDIFKMTAPPTGFAGEVGYSLGQARAAAGPDAAFSVTCQDNRLVFEKTSGEAWSTGETITFYWKSTVPPKGPAEDYSLGVDGKMTVGTGPVPGTAPADGVKGCS